MDADADTPIKASLIDVAEVDNGVRIRVCDATSPYNGLMGSVIRWEKTSVHVLLENQEEGDEPRVLRTTSVGVVASSRAAAITSEEEEEEEEEEDEEDEEDEEEEEDEEDEEEDEED